MGWVAPADLSRLPKDTTPASAHRVLRRAGAKVGAPGGPLSGLTGPGPGLPGSRSTSPLTLPGQVPVGEVGPDQNYLGTFTVWIGDAKFVVPHGWYLASGYWDVLPTEEDVLSWVWWLQLDQRAATGLSDDEVHGIWACTDLATDEGWFFKEIDSSGIGGYAGRTYYWITQYVAMYWKYVADGTIVAGETTCCAGIEDESQKLFHVGHRGPRWVVCGSRDLSKFYTKWFLDHRQRCCACVAAWAWTTGVRAQLGLPDDASLDQSGAYSLTTYPLGTVRSQDARCSVNACEFHVEYSYSTPGEVGGTRTFDAPVCAS